MAYQINLAPFFAGVITDASAVSTVAAKAGLYVQVVEQAGAALKLSTAQKQSLFQNLLLQDIAAWSKPLADELTAAWPKMQGVINAVISLLNLFGWAFASVAPIIEAADPATIPAITAINAAAAAVAAASQGKPAA